jgi:hypothetical protein
MEPGAIKKTISKINIFLVHYFKLVMAGIFVLLLVSGFFFLIFPKYRQITREVESAGEAKNAEYLKRRRYLDQLEKLKAEYLKINPEDIKRIDILLPKENNREELFAQLEDLISKSGFILNSLSASETGDKQSNRRASGNNKEKTPKTESSIKPKEVKISMHIEGTNYEGFKNLLHTLENNLRLMDVTKLSFDPKGNKTSLDFIVYYLPDSEK